MMAERNRLVLDAYKTPNIAELAPMIDGKPDFTKLKEIDLVCLILSPVCKINSLRNGIWPNR
jgi:hypothetical protein